MVKNYLLIALRSIRKNFAYSLINIFGLGLGLTVCILIVIWIQHELSFDRFHQQNGSIYRASLEYSFGGQTSKTSVSPTALLPVLSRNFSEIKNGVRLYNPASFSPFVVSAEDKKFQESGFYFADSSFFSVFSFPLIKGAESAVLNEPNTIVFTESSAKKYFGTIDPIGKVVRVNDAREYIVTGVMKDLPDNSTLQADFIASFSTLPQSKDEQWWSANYETFFVLDKQADVLSLASKANALVKEALASELTGANDYVVYNWIPLTDIHLYSDMNESVPVGNIQYVYIFSGVALIILLLAAINYINLATARAMDRAKEVGIRKTVGAERFQLIFQHLTESFLVTLFAFLVALLFVQLLLPFFNSITGKELSRDFIVSPLFIGVSSLSVIVITVLAGAYPALAITSFRPVSILKGNFKTSARGLWLRKSLVVAQFCISVILMVGTVTISKQLDFMQNKKLGYEKESIILLPLDNKTEAAYTQLKTEFLRTGKATSVTRATESPTNIRGGYSLSLEGSDSEKGIIITANAIDPDFIPTLDMELLAGRNYTEADMQIYKTDTTYGFIVNESTLHELGLEPENAIGKKANVNGRKGEIIGVVKDFHFTSLHEPIAPFLFFNEEQYNYIFVKLQAGPLQETLASLEDVYDKVVPHRPFEYEFLDQQYEALYTSEQRLSTLFSVFAGLAMIIACLGLFGLVSFSASQRTKEIGIRKVLGATASSIVLLITREYTRLILLAIILAIPISVWINNLLLDGFAYKTTVGPFYLVSIALASLAVALGTASFQAIKASLINPSESMRSE